jgi:hypothetical protein
VATAEARRRTASRSQAGEKPTSAATPWGAASILDEVSVPQRVGEKRFGVLVQLLETKDGERLVRFAYTTSGSARRGPVTIRARDLERLRAALERAPVLGQVLRV